MFKLMWKQTILNQGPTVSEISRMQQKCKLKPRGGPFARGTSGNPKGNEDVNAAAREYTVEAIHRFAYCMRSDDSRASVMTADKLLDRAWGRPSQDVKLLPLGYHDKKSKTPSAKSIPVIVKRLAS